METVEEYKVFGEIDNMLNMEYIYGLFWEVL